MVKRIVILGAGGNAADIIDIIDAINSVRPVWDLAGMLDDAAADRSMVYGHPILGKIKETAHFAADTWFINAIGSEASFTRREQIIAAAGLSASRFATLIHPGAGISKGAVIGAGSYACFGVCVGNGVRVGRHVHLGSGCVLGHDASVDDFSLIGPRAVLSGFVRIGPSAYVGAGASVKQKVAVGAGALVGMGAVVVGDVASGSVVAGNPARPLAAR